MKLYTAYSANYDKALTSIQAFSKKNPQFAEFLDVTCPARVVSCRVLC